MSTLAPARVLVVDDDEMLRVLTRAALENAGFTVAEAADGGRLIEAFTAVHPDIVLLDVLMPGMDGFEACALLRASAGGAHLPVLMMTGLDDVESINRAYQAGATDFVTKPINFDLLGHRLRYMLRAKNTADALRASEARLALAQRIARLGHWEADARGRFAPWTVETREVLGLPAGVDVIDVAALTQFVVEDDRDRLRDAFGPGMRNGKSFSLELRVCAAGDAERNIHVVAVAEHDADGAPRYVGTVQDVSERRRAEQQIHQLAYYDGVTGLPNRQSVRARLVQALASAAHRQRPLAVLSIDLDHFQRINDTLGFAVGNELLRAVGERLCATVRVSDPIARLTDCTWEDAVGRAAGDEFIAVLANVGSAEDAALFARRLRTTLGQPFEIAGQEMYVRVSIGISVYPDDGVGADDLLKHADAALAQAKREGRDCYQFYTSALNVRAFKRLTVEMHLRRALEREQFEVHFQPKVRGSDLRPVGFEALVRWNHPDLGRVSPAEFIPVAEETGLVVPLGEWVLGSACRQLASWDAAGVGRFVCAVNLSAAQFRARNLHRCLADVVAAAGLEAGRIELELTEGVIMEDGEAAIRTLNELKAHGFRIAVDDFGTGYSSLSYLKRLPIDVLKIDQSFVRELAREEDAAIVSTIISMARSLRLKVVAEGVEESTQLAFLRAQGCDELQGYLLSPPLPALAIEAWLERQNALALAC
ncbi:MAG: EAL domain-containing protein [Gammaproteobacteria bacterium]|nr:EAL domain-containing protein [Gammaproteobacteria bacterium]